MGTLVLDRGRVIVAMQSALEPMPVVRAAWLAGSDANGRTDDLSDVDLVVLAQDDAVEAVFGRLEESLAGLSPVELRYDVPTPTWHGHDQRFYRLRDAPPGLLADIVIIKQSAPRGSRFLESERHGRPIVLFDRDDVVRPAPFDRPAHVAKMRARLEALKVRFRLLQCLVTKAVARRQPTDAAGFYHAFTLLPVVEALRMLHCPDRYDFAMRYLRDDLPADVLTVVERLSFNADLNALASNQREGERVFEDTVRRLEAKA